MTLGERQELFSRLIAEHILWLISKGYGVRCGDFFRDPRAHGEFGEKRGYSSARSYHKLKLAADLNLTMNGIYLDETEDHRESGEKWKSRHPMCVWGGDFDDGNHYSMFEMTTKGGF